MAVEKRDDQLERPGASASSDSDLEILAQGAINEKNLLGKLDLRLLPAVSILYLLSFLDRSNGMLSIPFRHTLAENSSGQRPDRGSYYGS
jgi:hypothetical protein